MSYIGIPFDEMNCYDLTRHYYKNELDIDLPSTLIQENQPRRIMINFLNEISKNWVQIDKAEKDCVVVMATHNEHPKLITHFGVMIDDKRMLHTFKKTNSHIMNIDDMRIKPMIRGFYKWQN